MKTKLQFVRTHLGLLIRSSLLVVALAALGLLGIVAVRFIPDGRIVEHAERSVGLFVREGDWPLSLCSRQDNFMDSMSVNIASYERCEGALESALKNHFWVTDVSEGVGALAARFSRPRDSAPGVWRTRYVRYWFGAIVLVRPLLFVMDYPQWRMLNTVVVFAALAVLLYLMRAAGLVRYGAALLISVALMDPVAIGKSVQFSPCFYLSMLPAMVFLLIRKTRFVSSPSCLALSFAGIGALTSYFDLLTYPILTFALPMAFCMLVNFEDDVTTTVKMILTGLVHWSLGFVLMWLLKWVLVTAFTDVNAFYEVFHKVIERSGSVAGDGMHISRLHAVRVNFLDFLPYMNVSLAVGGVLALLALRRGGLKLFVKWIPGFLIAFLPPAWMFLTANHVYIHHFFTCKSLAVTLFVFLCWVTDALFSKMRVKRL